MSSAVGHVESEPRRDVHGLLEGRRGTLVERDDLAIEGQLHQVTARQHGEAEPRRRAGPERGARVDAPDGGREHRHRRQAAEPRRHPRPVEGQVGGGVPGEHAPEDVGRDLGASLELGRHQHGADASGQVARRHAEGGEGAGPGEAGVAGAHASHLRGVGRRRVVLHEVAGSGARGRRRGAGPPARAPCRCPPRRRPRSRAVRRARSARSRAPRRRRAGAGSRRRPSGW